MGLDLNQPPELWRIRDGMGTKNFMRMTDGAPEAKVYILETQDGRRVAEIWTPMVKNELQDLEKLREDAVLIQYAPMLFWSLGQINKSNGTPEEIKDVLAMLLRFMNQSHKERAEHEPASEAVPSGE